MPSWLGDWEAAHPKVATMLLTLLLVTTSAAMVSFNKYLVHENRFPFSTALVAIHMISNSTISLFLYWARPSLFPSLKEGFMDQKLLVKGLLPIGAFMMLPLVLNNSAYLFASLEFLQMLKESNLVFVHLLSVICGLEAFRLRNMPVMFGIVGATAMTVRGELHFNLTALVMQVSAILCEACRMVMQGMLLSAKGVKLDSFSYVLLMSPCCLFYLICLVTVLKLFPVVTFATPGWSNFAHWWPSLLFSALMAYSLNVLIAAVLKRTSPTACCFAGLVKDMAIVLMAVLLMHEDITFTQVVSFGVQLSLISLWTVMKTFPEEFEEGVLAGLGTLIWRGPRAERSAEKVAEKGAEKANSYGAMEEGNALGPAAKLINCRPPTPPPAVVEAVEAVAAVEAAEAAEVVEVAVAVESEVRRGKAEKAES